MLLIAHKPIMPGFVLNTYQCPDCRLWHVGNTRPRTDYAAVYVPDFTPDDHSRRRC